MCVSFPSFSFASVRCVITCILMHVVNLLGLETFFLACSVEVLDLKGFFPTLKFKLDEIPSLLGSQSDRDGLLNAHPKTDSE